MNIATSSGSAGLDSDDQRQGLLRAIERSIRVHVETDFFNWTQGSLQAAIPHEVLWCASFDPQGRLLDAHACSHMPLPESDHAAFVRAGDGLLHRLMRQWDAKGRSPLLIDVAKATHTPHSALCGRVQAPASAKVAAHGSAGPGGRVDTFFAFGGVRAELDRRLACAVEILVPHLRAAFVGLRLRERKVRPSASARTLSVREGEILQLMHAGCSNAEIGSVLGISPLTVKNHVQKVLRKLGVRNRTQAVALNAALRWHAVE